jgi:predicted lysophospholipase L1 biosynthesis ABC-type transport system permease subunit
VKLPEGTRTAIWAAPLRPKFDSLSIRMRTVEEREGDLTDAITQLARFLSVVGLIALLLGRHRRRQRRERLCPAED